MQVVLLVGLLITSVSFVDVTANFQPDRFVHGTICPMANKPSDGLMELRVVMLSDLMHYRLLKDATCPDVSVTYVLADEPKDRSVQIFRNEIQEADRLPGLKIYCATVAGKFIGNDNNIFLIYKMRQFKRVKPHKNKRFDLSEVNCEK